MTDVKIAPIDQPALWNGPAGETWVAKQEMLDALFAPVADYLADAVGEASPHRLLDIGCGTGATVLAAAQRLGVGGDVLGVDISARMIARARKRAAAERLPVRFEEGDAEEYDFPTEAFDMAISRFGVMFFSDSVAAFANIRAAMVPKGVLHAVAWRSARENDFMTTAWRAAAPILPAMPAPDPNAPGQFAFASNERVLGFLWDAGWSDIVIEPIDFACTLPTPALADYVANMGPLGLFLAQFDPAERGSILARVLPAFDRYIDGDTVHVPIACWSIRARA
ncbi:class I SAM-dependent methyltransferase [Sphingopyxis sp. PAMC25046]|uniref:class I SAM-dependent methyltransferase n=1 Tax=Sphingopyxis sp. PAMC25046 TaxID=2565556 RepID=UPI00109E0C55|nr:class I SAM-dependent methyltransferase [Sphingopyxis sp. PAMC25046]QCB54345.1 class I SAM-dependent methyltransferase [Sphingopyxis sp. PAMC25046]